MKKCICKVSYEVPVLKYLGGKPTLIDTRHVEDIWRQFKQSEKYPYTDKKGVYMVADNEKHLKYPRLYPEYVEYFSESEFRRYFVKTMI